MCVCVLKSPPVRSTGSDSVTLSPSPYTVCLSSSVPSTPHVYALSSWQLCYIATPTTPQHPDSLFWLAIPWWHVWRHRVWWRHWLHHRLTMSQSDDDEQRNSRDKPLGHCLHWLENSEVTLLWPRLRIDYFFGGGGADSNSRLGWYRQELDLTKTTDLTKDSTTWGFPMERAGDTWACLKWHPIIPYSVGLLIPITKLYTRPS